MVRRFVLTAVVIVSVMLFMACATAGPESTPVPAAQVAATEIPAVEAVPTEEASSEAVPTEEPAAEPTDVAEEETAAESGEEATYQVDPEASMILWRGSQPLTGVSETGTVDVAEGYLTFTGTEFLDGMIIIDMQTIATTSQTGGMAGQLIGHLSSDDFFGVETYPTANLVIKSAEPTAVENQYLVTADLTIKSTTNEIEFITDVTATAETLTATADIVVDRAAFDVRYGSGSFFSNLGNDLISDEMEMSVTLVANR